MPRPLRVQFPGAIYHVTAHGVGDRPIFFEDTDRVLLLDLIERATAKYDWVSFGYCLLTTHYHVLVQTRQANIARGMQWVNGLYGQRFNHRHDQRGHLFGSRYYAGLIESERHLLSAIRYLAWNAAEARICDDVFAWPWSSYPAVVGRAIPRAVHVDEVLGLAGTDPVTAIRTLRGLVEPYVEAAA